MSDTLSCTEVLGHLPLHVGDDLDEPLARSVAGHVEGCASCREALARAREARRALIALSAAAASPHREAGRKEEIDLWPAIRSELDQAGLLAAGAGARGVHASRSARQPIGWLRARWWVPLTSAAAALPLVLWLTRPDPVGPIGPGEPGPGAASGGLVETPQPGWLAGNGSGAGMPAGVEIVPAGLQRLAPGESRLGENAAPYLSPFERLQLQRFDPRLEPRSRPVVAGDTELR